jgi:hypothetical protein
MAKTVEELLTENNALLRAQQKAAPSLGLGSSPKDFKDALTVSKSALTDFGKTASNSLNVWRDLSKTGAAFSNDIIGMSTAAAQSRMSLDEFSKVIRDNGKYMTGLGGSVGRGAEVFSKLSKSFFDSNMDRGLRELGYTSKELNDVLALTAGAQKSAFSDTEAGQKRTNQAAAAMAKEMDLIAKLTGKSRAEQMEEMTKRKVDGQTEAKLRLLTAGKSEEEAAAIRLEYQKGLLEAQKQGTEQAYKEFFATGTYLSEEAATQAALLGKQARAQEESIKAMQGGDFAKAAEARERSASESLKNQSNTQLLQLATLGSAAGTAGESMVKQVEVNDALFHSVSKVKAEYEKQNGVMLSWGEALKIAKDRVAEEQQGKDKEGKARSGATEGLIAIEKAQQDFKAGLAGAAEAVDKDGKSLANALRDTGTVIKNVIKEIEGTAQGGNIGKNIEDRAKAGQRNEAPVIPPGTGTGKAAEIKRDASGGIIGDTTRLASTAANKGVGIAAEAVGSVAGPGNPIGPMRTAPQGGTPLERREKGGPVDAGTPYLVGEGGKAEIFVPKSAGDIVPMDKVGKTIEPKNAGLDLSTVSKDIKTTVSSSSAGASMPSSSMAKMGLNDDQKKMFDELNKLNGDQLKSKMAALKEEKSAQQILNKEAAAARDLIEERLENEGKTIKDLAGEDKKRFDELTKQLNDSFEASSKATDGMKVLKRVEGERRTDELFGRIQAKEEAKAIEKEKAAIVGKAQEDIKQGLTAHQQTVLKYAYEGQSWQEQNAKDLLKGEQNSLSEKQNRLAELEKEFEGKELNDRQKNRLEKLKGEIEGNKESIKIREDELFVFQNLEKLKVTTAENTAEEQAEALKRIDENRKKINTDETKSIAEQLSVYKQSNEAKTEEEKNTAEALARINENRKKINTDETTEPTAPVPIIKQDQLNKPIEVPTPSAATNPLLNDKGKISLNKLNLPGMPNFGTSLAPKDPKPADPKGAAASISEEAKRADAKKAEEKKKAEDAKKAEAAKGTPAAKPTGSVQQPASLNDVVKSLDQLNMQMGKLISQQSDLIRKQTSSMLAAGSNNVYDKTR